MRFEELSRLKWIARILIPCFLYVLAPIPVFSVPAQFPCPRETKTFHQLPPEHVYQDVPFQPGERTDYKLFYTEIPVGTAELTVHSPKLHQATWHQHFHAELHTSQWYDSIYYIHDMMESFSLPSDFRVSRFQLNQNEGGIFRNRKQIKCFDFNHEQRTVTLNRYQNNRVINEEYELLFEATDIVSLFYYLRTLRFEIGKPIQTSFFSSRKNLQLNALPLKHEQLDAPIGKFETVKLEIQTYWNEERFDQGNGYAWIARQPPFLIIKVEGRVKLGYFALELVGYTPGEG